MSNPFDNFPTDILKVVFLGLDLDPADFKKWTRLKLVCKEWNTVASELQCGMFMRANDTSSMNLYKPKHYVLAIQFGLQPQLLISKILQCPRQVYANIAATGIEGCDAVLSVGDSIESLAIHLPKAALVLIRSGYIPHFSAVIDRYSSDTEITSDDEDDNGADVGEIPRAVSRKTGMNTIAYKGLIYHQLDEDIDFYVDTLSDKTEFAIEALYATIELGQWDRYIALLQGIDYETDVLLIALELLTQLMMQHLSDS